MALKYFLEHSLWHKAYAATWRKSYGQQVKQSLILDECQRFSPSSPAIPSFINNTKTWTLQALSCIVTKNRECITEKDKMTISLLPALRLYLHWKLGSDWECGFLHQQALGMHFLPVLTHTLSSYALAHLCSQTFPRTSATMGLSTAFPILRTKMLISSRVCFTAYKLLSLVSRNHV